MSEQSRLVLSQALKLPPIERAELVEQILASFVLADRECIDSAWAAEAEDRIDGYDQGLIKSVPASDVFALIERDAP